MAIRLGLLGEPNSGKSFGRSFLDGEKCFAILPSSKETYLYKEHSYPKNPKPVDPLTIVSKAGTTNEELAFKLGFNANTHLSPMHFLVSKILTDGKFRESVSISGNYVNAQTMGEIPMFSKFVEQCLPNINIIILPDFTHFLSNTMGTKKFQDNKGYGKYVITAIEALNVFFQRTIDEMRKDIIVITEYHLEDREDKEEGIFVPAGKMLRDHFKPESYFDYLLGAKWISHEEDPSLKKNERYCYLTGPTEKFKFVRDGGLFEEERIPNNLQLVVEKIQQKHGIV